MKTVDILNDALASAKDQVESARKRVQFLKAKRRTFGRIVSMLKKSLREDDFLTVTSSGAVYVSMRDLSGFKCAELEMVLNTLENMGECKQTKDWAEFFNRDFEYTVDGITVSLSATVKRDSETCQRVVVGSEMVERLTYQLVCD